VNQINISENQDTCAVLGPLTFDTVQAVLHQCRTLFVKKDKLTIDLSKVTKCDSASVAFIIALLRESKKQSIELLFIGFPQQLRDLIRVGGLDSIISTRN
jgi:phospholipid transport system transporter-binding protein